MKVLAGVCAHRDSLTNYLDNKRKIILITPHQLSPAAKQLIRDGRMDFVKEVAGKGYFSGSTQIDQEIDIEMIIHIEKVNKKSYLTVQLGKHRLTTVAPDKDRYAVLEMHDVGGLWDDYGKADTTLLKVGGGAIGSADQNPFWESI